MPTETKKATANGTATKAEIIELTDLSAKNREALKGASNGGYHYFGSAKIFAQMGKAFAEANLKMMK